MSWDARAVRELIDEMRAHRGDLTSVEVKRGSGGVPDLAATLCAFGNMPGGGVIVVGLDEHREFFPVGVDDPAALEQGIAAQARTAVSPPVAATFTTVLLAGKSVVVAEVAGLPASLRPCHAGGRAYLRQADGDYVMSAQEEQQMLAARDRPRYDAIPVDRTTVDDLDPNLVGMFVRAVRTGSRRLREVDELTLLRRKGVLEANGARVTMGGLYALGQYPQQFAPSLSVTAAVVPQPGSADRLVDLVHFDGPIPDLLDASMEWLRRNLRSGVRVDKAGNNFDHPEFPLAALRELVANALVHRDLGPHTQSKRVEIRLRPDRLVISSPGGLWGVSREQLGTPAGKSAVNEYLYDVGAYLSTPHGARVIEGEGGGIGEAQRTLADWPAGLPIFVDKAVMFTVILMRPDASVGSTLGPSPESVVVGDSRARILAVLSAGALDRRAIGERTGLTPAQTRYALGKLVSSGQAVMNGGLGARNTTYSLTVEG